MRKAELLAASEKDKKEAIRSHLYKLVEGLSTSAAAALSVQSFCEGNIIYSTYKARASGSGRSQPESNKNKKKEGSSSYMGGMYSKPKSCAANAV